jgi:hypothetical protein
VLVLDMIEILPPLGKYKYDTWRIVPVKCYIDNSVCLWNYKRNVNKGLEEKLQERERLADLKLGRQLESLASRESDLVSHEAPLEVEQKNLEDACLKVLSRELAAEVHEASLRTQAVELADRER